MKKVLLTGKVASGKSFCCKVFKVFGCKIISSDGLNNLALKRFGFVSKVSHICPEMMLDSKKLSVKKDFLRKIIFSPDDYNHYAKTTYSSQKINEIREIIISNLHRYIKRMRNILLNYYQERNIWIVICEIPLFFEYNVQENFDLKILLQTNKIIRKKRFSIRYKGDHCDEIFENIEKMHFISDEEKINKCDIVIENHSKIKTVFTVMIVIFRIYFSKIFKIS